MKIKVEITMGFLSSGKTSFINYMLQGEELQNEIVVVIHDEFGECEIKTDLNNLKQQNQIAAIESNENKENKY